MCKNDVYIFQSWRWLVKREKRNSAHFFYIIDMEVVNDNIFWVGGCEFAGACYVVYAAEIQFWKPCQYVYMMSEKADLLC